MEGRRKAECGAGNRGREVNVSDKSDGSDKVSGEEKEDQAFSGCMYVWIMK